MSHFPVLVILPKSTSTDREGVWYQVVQLVESYRGEGGNMSPGTRFDWCMIGGRYTGAFDEYSPTNDPRNREACCECGGVRSQLCDRCHGEGTTVIWPTQWVPHDGDVRKVKEIRPEFVPFALVTPEGMWHERARVGGFGTLLDGGIDRDEWRDRVGGFLRSLRNHTAVIVDCHVSSLGPPGTIDDPDVMVDMPGSELGRVDVVVVSDDTDAR
jgi:hypothetical protein